MEAAAGSGRGHVLSLSWDRDQSQAQMQGCPSCSMGHSFNQLQRKDCGLGLVQQP